MNLKQYQRIKDVETNIAGIWQRILAVDRVGLDDNFFDLGGNSRRMILAYNEIQRIVNCHQCNIIMFFQSPTVRQLAKMIVDTAAANAADGGGAVAVSMLHKEGYGGTNE